MTKKTVGISHGYSHNGGFKEDLGGEREGEGAVSETPL